MKLSCSLSFNIVERFAVCLIGKGGLPYYALPLVHFFCNDREMPPAANDD
ncbi:MAG: hypothetical protein ACREMT_07780 [Vulcanimicrobiaceae bacterium]